MTVSSQQNTLAQMAAADASNFNYIWAAPAASSVYNAAQVRQKNN